MAKGTIIVTGANGGLGSAIADKILKTPQYAEYHTIFTVRKVETATVLNRIIAARRAKGTPPSVEVVALDLGRLASVRAVADDINARVADGRLAPVRALVLNAGFMEHTTQSFSDDGFDMTWHANYLGHWLLTVKLLKGMDKNSGRIAVVGSWSHDPFDTRNDMQGAYKEEKYKTLFPGAEILAKGKFSPPEEDPTPLAGFRRYGASKLSQIMMIHELQSRLDVDPDLANISVLGVDPGAMATGITRRGGFVLAAVLPLLIKSLAWITSWFQPNSMLRSPAKSATDVLNAAFSVEPPLGQRPKDLYMDGSALAQTSVESRDKAKLLDLWTSSIRFTQLKEGETALRQWN